MRYKELKLFLLERRSLCGDMMIVFRFLSDGRGMWLVLHDCEGKNSDSGMENSQQSLSAVRSCQRE